MSVGQADLAKALATAWTSWGLDNLFKSYWSPADKTTYPSLHEGEATPGQPLPYCVYELDEGNVVTRMTGRTTVTQLQIRDVPCVFNVFAKEFGPKSAKEVASELNEELMRLFGGHPTGQPNELTLEHGKVLLQQYQSDYSLREGDSEYRWVLNYIFRLDVPVRLKG